MPTLENVRAAVLDTHVWVWASAGDSRAEKIRDFQGQCMIASISLWEIAMLESKGRLRLRPSTEAWIQSNLKPPMMLEQRSPAIAIESSRLTEFHGDPADRIIVATAYVLGVPLITADEKIWKWNQNSHLIQIFRP